MIRFWQMSFACVLLSLVGFTAFAQVQGNDELRLRDGTVVRGEAVSHNQDTVVSRSAEGVRTDARRDVTRIIFGGVPAVGGIPTGISTGPGLRIICHHPSYRTRPTDSACLRSYKIGGYDRG